MNINFPTDTDITSLRTLWKEAFNDTDEFLDLFFTNGFSPERCLFISQEGCAVSALYWFDCEYRNEKIAYIYAVATAASHRGKGLCHQLMNQTHNHLKSHGYAGVILVPGSSSLFRLYQSMGYKTSCHVHEFACDTNNHNTNLTLISNECFAKLRRSFLPENSVIQEMENLRFLSSYADFYKGEDFILAAHKDKDTLLCAEILGNTAKASEIVNTLGCKKGVFRTCGDSKPFAMYLSLNNNFKNIPSYFGFAFD